MSVHSVKGHVYFSACFSVRFWHILLWQIVAKLADGGIPCTHLKTLKELLLMFPAGMPFARSSWQVATRTSSFLSTWYVKPSHQSTTLCKHRANRHNCPWNIGTSGTSTCASGTSIMTEVCGTDKRTHAAWTFASSVAIYALSLTHGGHVWERHDQLDFTFHCFIFTCINSCHWNLNVCLSQSAWGTAAYTHVAPAEKMGIARTM